MENLAEYYAGILRAFLTGINNTRKNIYADNIDKDREYTDKLIFDVMAKLELAANFVENSKFKNQKGDFYYED